MKDNGYLLNNSLPILADPSALAFQVLELHM
jgi:hypothetical protein